MNPRRGLLDRQMTSLEYEMGKQQASIEDEVFVFAYGSNLDSERMKDRVPSASFVGVSDLPGHSLRFNKRGSDDGTGKANAYPTALESDRVEGVIYQIDETHLTVLDRFEGGYHRRSMPFSILKGVTCRTYQAWVYIAQDNDIDPELLPTRWYVGHVLRGAVEHGLSAGLVAELEEQEVQEEGVGAVR
jgi:gamma-glutamylcyclotransferase (GGCT)/AIG2-like uncharacterized protein YtfP